MESWSLRGPNVEAVAAGAGEAVKRRTRRIHYGRPVIVWGREGALCHYRDLVSYAPCIRGLDGVIYCSNIIERARIVKTEHGVSERHHLSGVAHSTQYYPVEAL